MNSPEYWRPYRRVRTILNKSLLIRLFGIGAGFLHDDPTTQDRWRFVKRHLPTTNAGERVFDVGCGSGNFTIALAKRGYDATGLSWDENNQYRATDRAALVGETKARFPIGDARKLDQMTEHIAAYDYVLSLENIEHIIDDAKLMRDLAACLKPGGWLVLSTPNKDYRAITKMDRGPFNTVEEWGWHVRRGYTHAMLRELAAHAGLVVEEIGYCSGFFSQKLTWIFRRGGFAGWLAIFPLRILPPLLDRIIPWPGFSITMVAHKPRLLAG